MRQCIQLKPFDLAVNTAVVQVLTNRGKVAGVRAVSREGRIFHLYADNVILAASTFDTPRILFNSHIAGPAVGHYLANHSNLLAAGEVNVSGFSEPLGVLGIIVPQTAHRPIQLQLQGPGPFFSHHYEFKPIKKTWELGYFAAFGKVEPRYENRVYIDPRRRDEFGLPEICVQFYYSARDEAIMERMAVELKKAASVMKIGLSGIGGESVLCRVPPGGDYHDTGTCRMGENPWTSGVDRYCQIHGIRGLYVADNSALPSTGASNPTLTTAALSIAPPISLQNETVEPHLFVIEITFARAIRLYNGNMPMYRHQNQDGSRVNK